MNINYDEQPDDADEEADDIQAASFKSWRSWQYSPPNSFNNIHPDVYNAFSPPCMPGGYGPMPGLGLPGLLGSGMEQGYSEEARIAWLEQQEMACQVQRHDLQAQQAINDAQQKFIREQLAAARKYKEMGNPSSTQDMNSWGYTQIYQTVEDVVLRKEKSSKSARVKALPKGEKVIVVDRDEADGCIWGRTRDPEGWILLREKDSGRCWAIKAGSDPAAESLSPMMVQPLQMWEGPQGPPPGLNMHMGEIRPMDEEQEDKDEEEEGTPGTTVSLRNIPNNYKREMLLDLLDEKGYKARYNFLYLPIDFKKNANLGYAFLNFVDEEIAQQFRQEFEGFSGWSLKSTKKAVVKWGRLQGYDDHVKRYMNSPVMHDEVPEHHRPLLFKDGERIDWPAPTKKLKAPWKKSRGAQKQNTTS